MRKFTVLCLVALIRETLVEAGSILFPTVEDISNPELKLGWGVFGQKAWMYGLGPLWAYKKHHDQTHNTTGEAVYAPENLLYVAEGLNTVHDQLFVTPNPNVLYASAHLNLTENSVKLFVEPNPHGFFYSWQIMDAFTDSRWYISSTNNPDSEMPNTGQFAFVYKNCKGENCGVDLDDDITVIEVRMPNLWIVARYYVPSDEKLNGAHEALLGSTLGVTKGYNKSAGNKGQYESGEPERKGMNISEDPIAALDNLNQWISYNGYGKMSVLDKKYFHEYGLGGKNTEKYEDKPKYVKRLIRIGVNVTRERIYAELPYMSDECQRWTRMKTSLMGTYGRDYFARSTVAKVGLGANIPSIGTYYIVANTGGTQLKPLVASSSYTITLPGDWGTHGADDLPYNEPGFWSVTAYNRTNGRLLDTEGTNPHFPGVDIVKDNTGKVVIFLSSKNPGRGVNWLHLPKDNDGEIYLLLRIYGAKDGVVSTSCKRNGGGDFIIPPVLEVQPVVP